MYSIYLKLTLPFSHYLDKLMVPQFSFEISLLLQLAWSLQIFNLLTWRIRMELKENGDVVRL